MKKKANLPRLNELDFVIFKRDHRGNTNIDNISSKKG